MRSLLILVALIPAALFSQDLRVASADAAVGMANPVLGNPAAIKAGLRLYRQICMICHLKSGGRGPNIFRNKLSPAEFQTTVLNGRANTQMPAFKDRLTPEQVWQLHAYLMSRDRY